MLKRGVVHRLQHYNTGCLFSRMRAILEGVLLNAETADRAAERIEYVVKSLPNLEAYLGNGPFVCGNDMTIADFACISSISSMENMVTENAQLYPKIVEWIGRMKQLPYYEECNGKGAVALHNFLNAKIKKNTEKKNKAKL